MDEHFVDLAEAIPSLQFDIRYATSHNLTGRPLNGYNAPKALMVREGAEALRKAVDVFAQMGYGVLVYDTYRPQRAVQSFMDWSLEPEDGRTREEFYPTLEKTRLFELGYIAERSGHSRGSAIDLTLTKDGVPLDMGTTFDMMDESSHHHSNAVSAEVAERRALLRGVMAWAGFLPLEDEWWHYRLMKEPFPDTYFDFPIE